MTAIEWSDGAPIYRQLKERVVAMLLDGVLKPGDRLPPQRTFAYQRKIATSTASRVYTELLRRGLVVGEVGRGTFVSGETRRGVSMPMEPRGARIDLEVNYPILPTQSAMIARSLEGIERPDVLDLALRHSSTIGTQAARAVSDATKEPLADVRRTLETSARTFESRWPEPVRGLVEACERQRVPIAVRAAAP